MNPVKNLPFLALLALLALAACHNAQEQSTGSSNDTTLPAQKPLTRNKDTAVASLMPLAAFDGQYPTDVALLDNPLLTPRLKALLGAHYSDFRKYWNTETPIVVEADVLSTTGCEEHNCAANQYVLQIDLKSNNINIYHFGKDIQRYTEKGLITLPPGLAKEFATMIGNRPA
jgi:hypothetical protein